MSPVILPLKRLFQKTCQPKINWDETLSTEISWEWLKIIADITSVPPVDIDPSLLKVIYVNDILSIKSHGFCDASKMAYGACVYLRIKTAGDVFINLITAKTRIVSLEGETIPRLEWIGALSLDKLMSSVSEAFSHNTKFNSLHCWTDSQIVLHWIYSKETYKKGTSH